MYRCPFSPHWNSILAIRSFMYSCVCICMTCIYRCLNVGRIFRTDFWDRLNVYQCLFFPLSCAEVRMCNNLKLNSHTWNGLSDFHPHTKNAHEFWQINCLSFQCCWHLDHKPSVMIQKQDPNHVLLYPTSLLLGRA